MIFNAATHVGDVQGSPGHIVMPISVAGGGAEVTIEAMPKKQEQPERT